MTQENIERLIRAANPVPDVTALEPVDVSLLVLEQQRRTEMPSNNRPEMDPGPEKRRTGTLIGVALAAIVVIAGLLAIGLLDDDQVAAPQTTVVTTTEAPATSTTDVTSTSAPEAQDVELFPAGQGPGATLTLSKPAGWTNLGWAVGKGSGDELFISYWYVDNVFGDRCNSAGDVLDPVPGPTVDDLTTAFVEAWGPHATAPVDVTLGGYSGKYMVLTVPTVSDECPRVNMNGWMETGAAPVAAGSGGLASRYYIAEGQIEEIWILDVDGVRQVINSSYLPGASAADRAEAQEIVDSIRIQLDAAP